MANIELIKILNQRTGAGLMTCKEALAKNNDDLEKASDWLRQQGIIKMVAKSDRDASEGLCLVKSNEHKTVLIEVNCETDFVARCDDFKNCVDKIADVLLNNGTEDDIKAVVTDAFVKLRENIVVKRTKIIDHKDGEFVFTYTHLGGKIITSVTLDKNLEDLGRKIAMQVADSKPQYISLSDVTTEELDREREIQRTITLNGNVKPEMVDRIVENRVNAHFKDLSLLSVPYLFDNKKTVEQALEGAKVLDFTRFKVGEN